MHLQQIAVIVFSSSKAVRCLYEIALHVLNHHLALVSAGYDLPISLDSKLVMTVFCN